MSQKEEIRRGVWERMLRERIALRSPFGSIPAFRGQEEAAELVRELDVYREASQVFVSPDYAQYEIRLNVLKDGKILLMATPGLRDGFYEVNPDLVLSKLWQQAVRSSGITYYGRKLVTTFEAIGKVDLMITGAVAVSIKGDRIGKGTGYFDQEYAILKEIGSVDMVVPIVAVVHEFQVYEELPFEENDISVDYIVTPERVIKAENPRSKVARIRWELLHKESLKKRPFKELLLGV